MKYFVCGFSGAGKTTLLNKLKDSEKYSDYLFVDLDRWILGKHPEEESLGDLIETKGWNWFRTTEKESLMELLQSPNIWVALGGGTLSEELARHLADRDDVKGYWLDTDFETCWQRIQNDNNRPLVKEGRTLLKHLYEERVQNYQRFERITGLGLGTRS